MNYRLNHLRELEAESIFILREVAAQFNNPVLLFSGGKDSIIVSYLAKKAFYPAKMPFALLHIDTGHNFRETIEYRDFWVKELGCRFLIGSVQTAIDEGKIMEETKHLINEAIIAFDKANESTRKERSNTYELKIEMINNSIKELSLKHKETSDTIMLCLRSIQGDIQANEKRLNDCETEIKLLKKV